MQPTDEVTWWDGWASEFKTRDDLATRYAELLRSFDAGWSGWPRINDAIVRRWSIAALEYIKTRAWKIAGSATQ